MKVTIEFNLHDQPETAGLLAELVKALGAEKIPVAPAVSVSGGLVGNIPAAEVTTTTPEPAAEPEKKTRKPRESKKVEPTPEPAPEPTPEPTPEPMPPADDDDNLGPVEDEVQDALDEGLTEEELREALKGAVKVFREAGHGRDELAALVKKHKGINEAGQISIPSVPAAELPRLLVALKGAGK
jgi:outer membrane biosynthesis protein TonB